ncbi:hypothetical protein Cpir12675_004582 [Ceratocystis pirilliformis]|uniref:Uncharacterized protein n=1 Tax=Ceratocystis pirilliformis TaxID=259994 RepID=A0ABR3YV97_9PEZI
MHREYTQVTHDKRKGDLKPGKFVKDKLEDESESSSSYEHTDSDSGSDISLGLPGYRLASGPGIQYDWSLCSDDCFWCGYIGLHDETAELSEELAMAMSRLRA